MPALINLKGKRFGKLLIVGDKITIKGRPSWPCACDCGKECLKSSHLLLTGDAQSCGCSMGHPIKELIGQKFGKLLVQELIRIEEKIFYKCLCDCGKITTVSAGNLNRKKHTQSCGCIRPDAKRKPSPIEIKEDHSEILITSKKYGLLRVLIDTSDIPKIQKYRWYMGRGYIVTSILNKHVYLHHVILPPIEGFITDHKDRNKLNNQSSNLRYATYQNNNWNSFPKKRGFKGAHYDRREKKWIANIILNDGTLKQLGKFSERNPALLAYDLEVMKLRGEFAFTNPSSAYNQDTPLQHV
jgi:hypothetical protein